MGRLDHILPWPRAHQTYHNADSYSEPDSECALTLALTLTPTRILLSPPLDSEHELHPAKSNPNPDQPDALLVTLSLLQFILDLTARSLESKRG